MKKKIVSLFLCAALSLCGLAPCAAAKAKVNVKSITLSKNSVSMNIGDTYTLTAKVNPTNATNKSVTWSSTDNSIVTVKSGKIYAVSAGSCIITAKSSNGIKAACDVTVTPKPVPVTSIKLSQSSMNLKVGDSSPLYASIAPANTTDPNVDWTCSDPSVVDLQTGKIVALKAGTCTITATTSSGLTATCTVTVTTPVPQMTDADFISYLNKNFGTFTADGKTISIAWSGSSLKLKDVTIDASIDNDSYSSWLSAILDNKKSDISDYLNKIASAIQNNYPNKSFMVDMIYQHRFSSFPSGYKLDEIDISGDGYLVTHSVATIYSFDGSSYTVDIS